MARDYTRKLVEVMLCFVIVVLACAPVYAQAPVAPQAQANKTFDPEKWKAATNDLDYPNENKPPKEVEKPKDEKAPTPPRDNWKWLEEIPASLRYLLMGLLAFAIVYILVKFLFTDVVDGDAKVGQAISLADLEERLLETDINPFLSSALEGGEFNLAIRLEYLALLKTMVEKGHIEWHRYKTNAAYQREIRDRAYHPDFKQLSLFYERYWYGPYNASLENFKTFETETQSVRQQIG
jgi:hypothetical protein